MVDDEEGEDHLTLPSIARDPTIPPRVRRAMTLGTPRELAVARGEWPQGSGEGVDDD